jgi:parvulin-like peptidyl-prolyl isomerase
MRRFYLFLLVSLCAGPSALGQPKLPAANGIVAMVNDTIITYQQQYMLAQEAIEGLPRPPLIPQATYEQKCEDAIKDSLETLLANQLIQDDFKNSGAKIPESLLDDEIQGRIRKKYGDRVTLIKTLRAQGLSYEFYRQQERERLVMRYMRYKKLDQPLVISPQKIERYYQNNLTNFQVDDQVKLRMIVLNSIVASMADDIKAMAREILLKIDEGVSFAEMASIYSEGSQASEGGDWDWRDRKFLKKGLSDVAFALQKGQHSGILGEAVEADQSYWVYQYNAAGQLASGHKCTSKDAPLEEKTFAPTDSAPATPQRFYLMMVEDLRPAHTRTIEQVRDEIEESLLRQERADLYKKWVDRLKKKAYIRYF